MNPEVRKIMMLKKEPVEQVHYNNPLVNQFEVKESHVLRSYAQDIHSNNRRPPTYA